MVVAIVVVRQCSVISVVQCCVMECSSSRIVFVVVACCSVISAVQCNVV